MTDGRRATILRIEKRIQAEVAEEQARFKGKFFCLGKEMLRLSRHLRMHGKRTVPALKVEIHAMSQSLAGRERENYLRRRRFKSYTAKPHDDFHHT